MEWELSTIKQNGDFISFVSLFFEFQIMIEYYTQYFAIKISIKTLQKFEKIIQSHWSYNYVE